MKMFNVSACSQDASDVIYTKMLVAEDEYDAIDALQDILEREQIEYGICTASLIKNLP